MAPTFVDELLSAVDAGTPPADDAVAAWAQQLPDASAAAQELTLVRRRLIALRPRAARKVDAVLGGALDAALQHVTQRAIDEALNDMVTGLPTRRLFERDCHRALANAARSGRPLSVVMVDVDGLKRVNDTSGHAAGDVHLRAVANALRALVRQGDGAYRIGGDEFALLLVDADQRVADVVLSRFCGPPVSWGVATSADGSGDADTLLATADARMYRSRQARQPAAAAVRRPRISPLSFAAVAVALAVLGTGTLMTVTTGGAGGDDVPPAAAAAAPAPPVSLEWQAPQEVTVTVPSAPVSAAPAAPAPVVAAPVQVVPVPVVAVPVSLPAAPQPRLVTPASPLAVPTAAAPTAAPDPGPVPAVVEDTVTLLEETVCGLLCS